MAFTDYALHAAAPLAIGHHPRQLQQLQHQEHHHQQPQQQHPQQHPQLQQLQQHLPDPAVFEIIDDDLPESVYESDMITPTSTCDRRDSFGNSIFSPQTAINWDDLTRDQKPISGLTNPFLMDDTNPFTSIEQPYLATYEHQPTWHTPDRASDPRLGSQPTHDVYANYEPVNAYLAPGSSAQAACNGISMPSSNVQPSSIFPPPVGNNTPLPLSPSSVDVYIPSDMDPRPLPKRMRQHSPSSPMTPNNLARQNGVRKKNARFEIPQERNLNNIDQLIAECNNDETVKELKQQKRLLRNRQAALDSRQRKKRHTEELEREKEDWKDRLFVLEQQLHTYHMQSNEWAMAKAQLEDNYFASQQHVQVLLYEKEELIAKHTRETGNLRKKISFLTEKLQGKATTIATGSTEYTDFSGDLGGLTMDADGCWEAFISNDEAYPDTEQHGSSSNGPIVNASRAKQQSGTGDADKPFATGAMFMLLLWGAYVASKSGDNAMPFLPAMSAEIRAASETLLNMVFGSATAGATIAGISQAGHLLGPDRCVVAEPGPSGIAPVWLSHKATMSGAELPTISTPATGLGIAAGSSLDLMRHRLAAPTSDQQAEQLFSLTADQYNALTSTDFGHRTTFTMPTATPPTTDEDSSVTPNLNGRKNLAASLQLQREEAWSGGNAADVCTRSLLWDTIPVDIVNEFKRMVRESERGMALVKSEG